MKRKIIESGRFWECENLDTLAPITDQGTKLLLSDNKVELYWDGEEIPKYEKATEKERKKFYQKRGFLFIGDEVEIVKGKKLPIGEKKFIKGFDRFIVPGTYNKVYTDYILFTDGTKTAIKNIKPTCRLDKGVRNFFEFKQGYNMSGRI